MQNIYVQQGTFIPNIFLKLLQISRKKATFKKTEQKTNIFYERGYPIVQRISEKILVNSVI